MEIYREILGFENYEISNFGNVKNIITEKLLKNCINRDRYYRVDLCNNDSKKTKYIHRLVAIAFINNQNNKRCVDHIDGNKTNNNFNNLRWATSRENSMNIKIGCKNTSGVKGVSWNKISFKWRADIRIDGLKVNLGNFETIEEAKQARQIKANEAFGVFTNACEKL